MILMLIMNGCFAVALPFIKSASNYMTPFELVALRMLSAGLLFCLGDLAARRLFPRWYYRQHGHRTQRALQWPLLLLGGFVGMYLLCGAEAWAISYMTATKATLIWALLPLITHAVVRLWGAGVPSSRLGVCGITLGMCGIFFLICADQDLSCIVHQLCSWDTLLPDLAMLSAVCAAAIDYIITQQIMRNGHGIMLSNGIMMLTGGILSALTAGVVQGSEAFVYISWQPALAYLGAIVILVNGIGLSLQSYLVTRHSVTLLALSSFLTPLLGVCMSLWWCAEQWNIWYTVAASCIIGGIYMFYHDELRRERYVA